MSDIETALELLYSDERLTSNLTDDQAKALLKWAADKIRQGVTVATVRSAATKANRDSFDSPAAVVAAADSALPPSGVVAVAAPQSSRPSTAPAVAPHTPVAPMIAVAPTLVASQNTRSASRPRQQISRPRRRNRLLFQR